MSSLELLNQKKLKCIFYESVIIYEIGQASPNYANNGDLYTIEFCSVVQIFLKDSILDCKPSTHIANRRKGEEKVFVFLD